MFRRQPSTDSRRRQRDLALMLPDDRFVTADDVRVLSPELARTYARAGERMPTRDLNALVALDLAQKQKRGYRSARAAIRRFRPPVAP